MIRISFSFVDEFGNRSTLNKTLHDTDIEYQTDFDLLVTEFKNFLVATGFAQSLVDSIIVSEIDESMQ